MRKPEVDLPTEYDKHLRAGRMHGRNARKKHHSDKRTYYHRLRGRLKEDLRGRERENG